MKILAQLIRRQLRLQTNEFGYCAIYENELQRVWPKNEENRKAKIARFAKEHGFRLIYYKLGLCAILSKIPTVAKKQLAKDDAGLYRKSRRILPCSNEAASHVVPRTKQFGTRVYYRYSAKIAITRVRRRRSDLRSSVPLQFASRVSP
jgi:hypothetical protein